MINFDIQSYIFFKSVSIINYTKIVFDEYSWNDRNSLKSASSRAILEIDRNTFNTIFPPATLFTLGKR